MIMLHKLVSMIMAGALLAFGSLPLFVLTRHVAFEVAMWAGVGLLVAAILVTIRWDGREEWRSEWR